MTDRVVLPPNLGWGRKRGRGIPTRQAPDPVVEEEVIPPLQSQNDTTVDTIATMLQQAMESLVGKIQAQPRESTLPGANKGHNQCNEPLHRSIREFLELKPPVFMGASEAEGLLLFLDGIWKALDTLECSSTRSVALPAYCLQDIAGEWFKSFKAGRPINSRPWTWKEFSNAFTNRFLPMSMRNALSIHFEGLRQTSQMSVNDYDIQSTRLSRHVSYKMNDSMRAKRFI
ncbi:hypothetical protein KY290_020874 [Solanum tuberosum]|uniref:Retrotransposon gag domain-containing protein n=1 Tax=Solanum tuberosum TaxID=4113 RepID=A0ABQ7V013_SOLTU|nr:hypothetical protein KY290_020874 [Solanum tuberosum]